ncbi:hypothetical protein BDZ45DRAFT_115290 [Acephala macrosclerotiorum]|nr:hypothetical protein BDZ45DRAFT_115290 [Acephala macrosclerotiorum]
MEGTGSESSSSASLHKNVCDASTKIARRQSLFSLHDLLLRARKRDIVLVLCSRFHRFVVCITNHPCHDRVSHVLQLHPRSCIAFFSPLFDVHQITCSTSNQTMPALAPTVVGLRGAFSVNGAASLLPRSATEKNVEVLNVQSIPAIHAIADGSLSIG